MVGFPLVMLVFREYTSVLYGFLAKPLNPLNYQFPRIRYFRTFSTAPVNEGGLLLNIQQQKKAW